MDWIKIPDLLAVTALVLAFASILRREPPEQLEQEGSPVADSKLWLYGWMVILLHFAASMGEQWNGWAGYFAASVTIVSLIAAAILFMRASVRYRKHPSSIWMTTALSVPPSIYILLLLLPATPGWSLVATTILISFSPLLVVLLSPHRLMAAPRYITVTLYFALGAVLLRWGPPHDPNGGAFALNAILFAVYFGCCLVFWSNYRGRTSSGSVITIGGLLAWALVFVVGPLFQLKLPAFHIEGEVWNLPKYVVAVGMLVLLLENQIERSEYLALHDDLTSLPNRRQFQRQLAERIAASTQAGDNLGLLQIDLDRFKQVNDAFGHHIGDLLLRQVAERMQSRIRRGDLLARTGGDEFSLILAQPNSPRDIHIVADALTELLRAPFSISGHTLSIGASIGAAVYPQDAQDASSLYVAADLRMYEAKEIRRGLSA